MYEGGGGRDLGQSKTQAEEPFQREPSPTNDHVIDTGAQARHCRTAQRRPTREAGTGTVPESTRLSTITGSNNCWSMEEY